MNRIKGLWQRTRARGPVVFDGGSFQCRDQALIQSFVADPNNTFLVSFPRTGSHWLRMLMELYFDRPSLTRIFYFPQRRNYLTLHTHDLNLDVERWNVIYLYRNPVDTIYSQLMYHNEDSDQQDRIIYWSDLYGCHLDKWLNHESFTKHKTILTYEGMKKDLTAEFSKVTKHFGLRLNAERLGIIAEQVTRDELKRKTKHDAQVIQLQGDYQNERLIFSRKWESLVWQVVTKERLHLIDLAFKA